MNQFITHRKAENRLLILVTETTEDFTEGIVVVSKYSADLVGRVQRVFTADVVPVTLNDPDRFIVLAEKLKDIQDTLTKVRLEATRAFDQEMFHKSL